MRARLADVMIRGSAYGAGSPGKTLLPLALFAIALAFLPFAVKRIAVLGHPDVAYWLAWDYSARCVSLIGVMLAYRAGIIGPVGNRTGIVVSASMFLTALLLDTVLRWIAWPRYAGYLAYFVYFHPPLIRDPGLLAFDLTVGVLLVAVSEELAFRRLLFELLQRYGLGVIAVVLISAVVFGLLHLTAGLADAIGSFLVGILFGAVFQITRRISLCVALHYIADLLLFWWRAAVSGAV